MPQTDGPAARFGQTSPRRPLLRGDGGRFPVVPVGCQTAICISQSTVSARIQKKIEMAGHLYRPLDRGMPPAIAAVSDAVRDRFRVVFLTRHITVLVLLSLLHERSDHPLLIVPFAVGMPGGLVASIVFSLLVLPVTFMTVEGWSEV